MSCVMLQLSCSLLIKEDLGIKRILMKISIIENDFWFILVFAFFYVSHYHWALSHFIHNFNHNDVVYPR